MITESHIIKLIKKSIKQFMCCCVGSTIGEGEPEGLAREGAIYIDEEAPALYYFDGTEWVVLPSAPPSLWERTGTILSPTTEDDSIELTGAKTISTPNQQTFDDNAAALTALAEVGEHYTTPDGVLHQVMASVPAKIYKVVFDLVTTGYNALSGGHPLTGVTIVYSDYTGVLGLNPLKYQNNFDGIRVKITSGLTIVDANVLFTFDTNQHFVPYVTRPASNIIDIIQTEDFVQQGMNEFVYPSMTITIQFIV